MTVHELDLPGVLLVQPGMFRDDRGWFTELWRRDSYEQAGIPGTFCQDNLSLSRRGVLRGLHYQHPRGQAKLVSVAYGRIFDVAVDVRRGSPHFGKWVGRELDSESQQQLFVPVGFAHGFLALSDVAIVTYKCSESFDSAMDHAIRWDDPAIGIDWPLEGPPVLSARDRDAPLLSAIAGDRLPPAA